MIVSFAPITRLQSGGGWSGTIHCTKGLGPQPFTPMLFGSLAGDGRTVLV